MAQVADWKLLEASSEVVARRLLGCTLVRTLPGGGRLAGKIVETEAYDEHDAASHSHRGRTPRTDVMFGPAGHLYVYFTYGMHYCCNVVTGPEGEGSAVLIRALEPLEGMAEMANNRGTTLGDPPLRAERTNLANGPAKLCQALHITKDYNGHDLRQPPLRLELNPEALSDGQIIQTTRVGISQAQDVPWRFYIRGNAFVSHR